MYPSLKRWLAVGSAAALTLVGLTAAVPSPASAAPAQPDATKAANYIVKNLPSPTNVGASITAALGLASAKDGCTYAPSLRTLVSQMEKGAKGYLYPSKKLNQARAASLAIAVKALGLNPKKFAGYNLVSLVTKSLPKDGRVGPSDSAFSQSLGIIALDRADATIPVTLLTKLLSLQDGSGAFGYEYNGFQPDPDTTALSILALHGIGQLDYQTGEATSWAQTNQKPDGYWDNYSPVDSTGLLGSALKAEGKDVSAALTWLGSVQHTDGGFPNSLDAGTGSDTGATAEALYLINGKSLLDISLNLGKCPKNPPKLPASVTSCTGVWVVVDRGNGQETVRCATKYGNGLDALKSAGFVVGKDKSGYLNRISGFPLTIEPWTSTSKYWSYWHASQNADGTWGDWQEYGVGGSGSTPVKGEAEGWYWKVYTGDATTRAFPFPPKGYSASPTPTIDKTSPKAGDTLTVTTGTWTPTPNKLAIQWYRSGTAIPKATKATYVATRSDAGKVITVKVTASGGGYQTVSKTSAPTAKVTK
jgi:hypothetical protein